MIATADADVDGPLFLAVHQSDPLAAPLLDELAVEYGARYGGTAGPEYDDLRAYPAEEFDPPHGALILAVCDGVPVAGGAFRRTTRRPRSSNASGRRRRIASEVTADVSWPSWSALRGSAVTDVST